MVNEVEEKKKERKSGERRKKEKGEIMQEKVRDEVGCSQSACIWHTAGLGVWRDGDRETH